jgi:hypothetical protein
VKALGFVPGTPVLVYLHTPRERVFGLLLSLLPAGVAVRGIDLASLEDWIRQEQRGDPPGLGLVSSFYPMTRVEHIERDETVGDIESVADRFARSTGRTVAAAAGITPSRRRRPPVGGRRRR